MITVFAAALSFLIGFVTARLMRLGGFVVVLLAILGIAGTGWLLGLDRMPGPAHVLLILVMLQAGFLGGALVFARSEAQEVRARRAREAARKADRPLPGRTEPRG